MGSPPVAAGNDGKRGIRIACLSSAFSETSLQIAEAFSPRIEKSNGFLYLDLGTAPDEEESGRALLARAVSHGLKTLVGIAGNKLTARLAAETANEGLQIIRPGEERVFLAPLPIEILHPPEEIGMTLQRWGIRTLGDLARLPSQKMISHLGKEGWELHQAARGMDIQPFMPLERTPLFLEKIDFDWSVGELEPLLLAATPLLDRLAAQLETRGMSCRALDIGLILDPKGADQRLIRLRAPTRDVHVLRQLIALQLSARPPGAPITRLTLLAHPDEPRQAQLSLFGPPSLSPARLATTLAQLVLLLGPERVGSPHTVDGYRPERFALKEYNPPPAPLLVTDASYSLPALTAIRVLRPPLPLQVGLETKWPWQPLELQSAKGSIEIRGNVRMASGPWRLEEHVGSARGFQRDYWDVELCGGGLYRIFYDTKKQAWFADGMYD
jgi:protein ImuB